MGVKSIMRPLLLVFSIPLLLLFGLMAHGYYTYVIAPTKQFKKMPITLAIYLKGPNKDIVEIDPEQYLSSTSRITIEGILINEGFKKLNDEDVNFHNTLIGDPSSFADSNNVYSKYVNVGTNLYYILVEVDETSQPILLKGSKKCSICM